MLCYYKKKRKPFFANALVELFIVRQQYRFTILFKNGQKLNTEREVNYPFMSNCFEIKIK